MDRKQLVVIGNGMVGHKLLAALADEGALDHWQVTTFCEEPRPAYDRVHLSSWFTGATADELSLVEPGFFATHGIDVLLGDGAAAIDREQRHVVAHSGRRIPYDAVVLATGSRPFVPPLPGGEGPGTFVYRTIEDLEAIAAWAERDDVRVGAVIGGGLLGLEAANALQLCGLETHVVEFAPRLMPAQLDGGGARALRSRIETMDIETHLDRRTAEVLRHDDGRVRGLRFDAAPGGETAPADLPCDLLLYSAGIRPRDELARDTGLEVGERGGIVVDDQLRTIDPQIFAIGEVACHRGRVHGLIAPGYAMARTLARHLADPGAAEPPAFVATDTPTKLKLLGVDVAVVGDAQATTPGAHEIVVDDRVAATYRKLVVDADGSVIGGILVGDLGAWVTIQQLVAGALATPANPADVLLPPTSAGGGSRGGVDALDPTATICTCENVTKGVLCEAIGAGGASVADLKGATRAGTGCGGCTPTLGELLACELTKAGVAVDRSLCAHFPHTRAELAALVRLGGQTTWTEVVTAHGAGDGCEICKPTVASILASLTNRYVLDGEGAAIQDTNDHALANLQRNGTYSVVPRVPGGELTPDALITIGEVARDFDLYTKITGGQRIDLFGARLEQLPAIWQRLVDAGMESGHAYGKALRTVKSCVGETWCRYGVQDSTSMAIRLELRYRGLRAPHKIKCAVSGCTRECAEAQSKDVGVIATERGWNLYVAGNGGMRPRHATLLATELDDEMLVRLIDRFLMFYVRTGDRLERTSVWFEKLDGGLDFLRSVLIDDALGICDELEADMARHVATYSDEWADTLASPERLRHFVSFVNAPDAADPEIVFVRERDQIRPATSDELALASAGAPLPAGSTGSTGSGNSQSSGGATSTLVEVRTR